MLATVKQPWLQIHKPVVISSIQATQLWGEGGQSVSIGGDMQSLTQLSNSSTGVSEDNPEAGKQRTASACVVWILPLSPLNVLAEGSADFIVMLS